MWRSRRALQTPLEALYLFCFLYNISVNGATPYTVLCCSLSLFQMICNGCSKSAHVRKTSTNGANRHIS